MTTHVYIYHGMTGGNAGPFSSVGDAIVYSLRYQAGLLPTSAGYDTIYIKGELMAQIVYEVHKCACNLCTSQGETFVHIRRMENGTQT